MSSDAGYGNNANCTADALRYKAVVISTPYDTLSARLINQSIQVRLVMTKNLVTLKTTDLLSDVREKMLAAKFVSYPVLERGKYVGMMDRGMMLVPDRQESYFSRP
ncbi:MAG: CBS domain-containing protein [Phascolarctobacterium faecium]